MSNLNLIFFVALGSFFGGAFRYLLSQWVQQKTTPVFPYGTLVVNLLGSFLIGIFLGWVEKGFFKMEARLFFITGILGGFTTFSAFSAEVVNLLRSGEIFSALLYVSLTVILGVLMTFLGITVFR